MNKKKTQSRSLSQCTLELTKTKEKLKRKDGENRYSIFFVHGCCMLDSQVTMNKESD